MFGCGIGGTVIGAPDAHVKPLFILVTERGQADGEKFGDKPGEKQCDQNEHG